jgi:hypothetical protein
LRDLVRYNLKTAWVFDDWCRQVMRSRIEPIKNIARSLRQHRELILNYFGRRSEAAFQAELSRVNNKVNGELPEPESTHEFF